MEIWRPVRNFGTHEVSNFGRVRNIKTGRILRLHPNDGGYLRVCLHVNNRIHNIRVHRLVAETFLELPDNHKELDVRHRDNDKTNNHVDNLVWCTRQESIVHAMKNGPRHGPRRLAVRVIETGEEYASIRECGRAIGMNVNSIRHRLNNPDHDASGYHFELI